MDLQPSDEQAFLREAVRGTVDRDAPLARVREWVLEGDVDHAAAFDVVAELGLTGVGLDEDAGGQGGGTLELAIVAEELGRGAVPADRLYGTLLANLVLTAAGRPELAADGDVVLARGGAVPLDADGPLDLVLGAPSAGRLLAFDGDALTLHEAAQVTPRRMVDRTREVGDVTDLGPVAERIDCDAGVLAQVAPAAAVLVAADAVGAGQRMLDLTVEYIGQRVQFGVAVGSFQAVKHAAAEMLVALEGARAAMTYAAWAVGAGEPDAATDAWVAKATASRMAEHVADKALFLHGAVGYTWEHDLQLLLKRAKSDAALLGGPGAYDARIADALDLAPVAVAV
jgi:alkylation response protein AidB-like acyl-CoA dehydrogenase